MRNFFRTFFAALLALIVFSLIVFVIIARMLGSIASKEKPPVAAQSVLVLDLAQLYKEQAQENIFAAVSAEETSVPGLYDVVRLLQQAKKDKAIAGIYIIANSNPNGFAANEELRSALQDFKTSGKFVFAHGDAMTQKAYSVANMADRLYISPQGFLEWTGYNVSYFFVKGTLEKLHIKPQIFYAGKFKSATEPFREEKMTAENKMQTTIWLNDIYEDLLVKTAAARNIDTATLKRLADYAMIQHAQDAVDHKLVDAMMYDDEVKDEIKEQLKLDKYSRINFITINTYSEAVTITGGSGEKIALIYAEGDIVDGKGDETTIGGDTYRSLVRKARLDKTVKAIVLRVNSGGGSAMASEAIWREMALAKQEKPVIVSFGDVAASGGYYIACAADSVFALPTTITGSIGVFGMLPNMEGFFKDKLGITFDGVKTAPYADAGAIYRPLNENEQKLMQAGVDRIYNQFKQRVAGGRRLDSALVDSIGQGRVWTGKRAITIGLVDRYGGIEDAVRAAAAMAGLSTYKVAAYPEKPTWIEKLLGKKEPMSYTKLMKEELGEENYNLYVEMKRVSEMTGKVQARMPFRFFIR